MPTLAIWGEKDTALLAAVRRPDEAKAEADDPADSGRTHLALEAADVNRLIREFLTQR